MPRKSRRPRRWSDEQEEDVGYPEFYITESDADSQDSDDDDDAPRLRSGMLVRDASAEELVHALRGRQWRSGDLVAHALGHIVSPVLAAKIVLAFLKFGVLRLHVQLDAGTGAEQRQWVRACFALLQPSDNDVEAYEWEWTHRRADAAEFFSNVGTLAFLVANYCDDDDNGAFQRDHPYHTRWIAPPRMPLSHRGEECCPDLAAFPVSAFSAAPDVRRPSEFYHVGSVAERLKRWAGCTSISRQPEASTYKPPPSPEQGHFIDSPDDSGNRDIPDEESGSDEDPVVCSSDLEEFLHDLPSFSEFLDEYLPRFHDVLGRDYVDLSRVCWPEVSHTAENKETRMDYGVRQEFVYMQQQRCTQPFMRFVFGVAVTNDEITVLTGDAVGTERQTFPKNTSAGVFNMVRLILGLTVAADEELGVNPMFDFRDVVVANVPTTAVAGTKRKDQDEISERHAKRPRTEEPEQSVAAQQQSTAPDLATIEGEAKQTGLGHVTPPEPLHYRHQEAAFVTLRGLSLSIDDKIRETESARYWLECVVANQGKLGGRRTCVWRAYKEVDPDDPLICKDDLVRLVGEGATYKVYVGPYALKFQSVDTTTDTYTNDLVGKVCESAKACPGRKYLLLPERVWYGVSILQTCRGYPSFNTVPVAVREAGVDRREVFAVTPFKRTLSQYESMTEVVRAIRDVYEAIGWLSIMNLIHRDISDSNVLFAHEDLSDVFPRGESRHVEEVSRSTRFTSGRYTVTLCRRNPHEPGSNVYGLLHDFDMVGEISDVQYINKETDFSMGSRKGKLEPVAKFRTGTPPYMAIELLRGKAPMHTVLHDFESAFYVLYLFPFTFGPPSGSRSIKARPAEYLVRPDIIKKWTAGTDLRSMGTLKEGHFSESEDWFTASYQASPYYAYAEETSEQESETEEVIEARKTIELWKEWGRAIKVLYDCIWETESRQTQPGGELEMEEGPHDDSDYQRILAMYRAQEALNKQRIQRVGQRRLQVDVRNILSQLDRYLSEKTRV